MTFIGLLTHEQKQAGYLVSQDEDFIFLWRGRNTNHPKCVGIFLFDFAKVRDIREAAELDMKQIQLVTKIEFSYEKQDKLP